MKKRIFNPAVVFIFTALIFLSNVAAQEASQAEEGRRLMAEMQASLKEGRHDDVIQKSTRLLEISPKSADVYIVRGASFLATGEKEKAVADFSQGLRLGLTPKMEVAAHMMRSLTLFQLKRYEEAIKDYTFLIQADSSDFRGYVQRGWSFFYLGNHQAAIADFDSALKLSPHETGIRRYRAISHNHLGNYEKAIEDITEEIKINPQALAEVYKIRAESYRKLGKIELAEADEKKFTEKSAHVPPPVPVKPAPSPQSRLVELFDKAQNHFQKNEWDAAIQTYNELLNLLGADHESAYGVYFARGRSFYEKGNLDAALADYNEVIKRRPNLASGYTFRGEVYIRKNQLDSAIGDFTKAVKLDAADILAFSRRAEAYNLKKDYDNAVKDSTEVIRLDPNFKSAWFWRANSYFEKGDFQAALKDISEYIRLDDNRIEAYSFRAKIHRKLKDEKAAFADEKKAEDLKNGSQIHE
jgi:tetratricopeptide (TPR) repeat protein